MKAGDYMGQSQTDIFRSDSTQACINIISQVKTLYPQPANLARRFIILKSFRAGKDTFSLIMSLQQQSVVMRFAT